MRKTFELAAFIAAVIFLLIVTFFVTINKSFAQQAESQFPLTVYETPLKLLDRDKEKIINHDGLHTRVFVTNCFERKLFEALINSGTLQTLTSGFTNPSEDPKDQLYSAILRDPEINALIVVITSANLTDGKVCVVSLFEPIKKAPPIVSER